MIFVDAVQEVNNRFVPALHKMAKDISREFCDIEVEVYSARNSDLVVYQDYSVVLNCSLYSVQGNKFQIVLIIGLKQYVATSPIVICADVNWVTNDFDETALMLFPGKTDANETSLNALEEDWASLYETLRATIQKCMGFANGESSKRTAPLLSNNYEGQPRYQKLDKPNAERAEAIMFSDDWGTAKVVRTEGIEVYGVIKTYQEKPDPHDDEHSVFILEYEYEVDSRLFKRELAFSINVVHIAYGYAGGLYNTPKFKYSLDDFRNSMQPGQKLQIRTLKKLPYWFWVEANEVMAEVMRHDAVWS